ncbi:MAG: 50S ribosomal protein L10 [bacterium]
MPLEPHPTPEKIETVQELTEIFQRAKGVYLADFKGLNVEQINRLRSNFRKHNIVYKVVKNTLIRHSCESVGYAELIPYLEGPTALAVTLDDPVLPVRLITDFHKGMDNPLPVIKAAILEKRFIPASDVLALKDIPSSEVLIAMIIGSLQAPMANFVGTLNEIVRSFLGVLDAIIAQKKAAESNQAEA